MIIKLLVLLLISWLSNAEEIQMLNFEYGYYNITTQGNLFPLMFQMNTTGIDYPFTVTVLIGTEQIKSEDPMTVVVQRGNYVLSEKLPLLRSYEGITYQYNVSCNTLCENDDVQKEFNDTIRILISTGSSMKFYIYVHKEKLYDFGTGPLYIISAPSMPIFYRYTFPVNVETVSVEYTADDDICGQLTVRKAHCPIFDSEWNVEQSGPFFYQTVTRKGFITVKKSEIGEKFHVVLTIFPNDSKCGQNPDSDTPQVDAFRRKNGTIRIFQDEKNALYYGASVIIYIFVFIILLGIFYCFTNRNNQRNVIYIPEVKDCDPPYTFVFHLICGALCPSLYIIFIQWLEPSMKSNLDTCSHNFQCALSWGIFPSLNSVISALSIFAVGLFGFCYRYLTRESDESNNAKQERSLVQMYLLAVMNAGLLMSVMNICRQKSTYHLQVFSNTLLALIAMFALIGKRDGLQTWHKVYIILVSVTFSVFVFLDKISWLTQFSKIGLFVVTIVAKLIFNYKYAGFSIKFLNCCNSESELWEIQAESEDEQESDEDDAHQSSKIAVENSIKTCFAYTTLISYIIINLLLCINVIKNITNCVLGGVQLEFVAFVVFDFIRKCINEPMPRIYITKMLSCLSLFSVLSAFCWYSRNYRLTSFIPHPPAWSRALNEPCLLPLIELDFYDLVNFAGAVSALCYFYYLNNVDSNIPPIVATNNSVQGSSGSSNSFRNPTFQEPISPLGTDNIVQNGDEITESGNASNSDLFSFSELNTDDTQPLVPQ